MNNQIRVGTGVKLSLSDQDLDYATGFVGAVGEGFSGPLYGVYWVWDGGPLKPDKLLNEEGWANIKPEDLCVWWTPQELTVVSQPDHAYWPSFWADWLLWALPEYNVDLEDGEGFVARMQHYGTPANPWID